MFIALIRTGSSCQSTLEPITGEGRALAAGGTRSAMRSTDGEAEGGAGRVRDFGRCMGDSFRLLYE